MKRILKPSRLIALSLLLAMLATLYVVALYRLQIVEGTAYAEQSLNSIVSKSTVTAARGNILDRYGRVLVSNRSCNNIIINTTELFEQDDPNAVILELVNIITAAGETYTDTLPVTMEAPFEYVENMTSIQSELLKAYISEREKSLDEDASAVELMAYFRTRYDVDASYDSTQMRVICGIRYELNSRYLTTKSTSDYIFVEDASIELVTKLMESGLPGFEVQESFVREYSTPYAAHILGYIGMMTSEEYYGEDSDSDEDGYQGQDYALNAHVGKTGAELAFESYLHGTDGVAAVTKTATGVTTSTIYTTDPEPGDHVYLTIDIGLQEAAETALSSNITRINESRIAADSNAQLATGGAVVAIDVATGEPLCIASYPTFDLASFMENFTELSDADNDPLVNRALSGRYAPGSTFKPITALAALNEGYISTGLTIYDEVTYMKYADSGYTPSCWIKGKGSHGDVNVTDAIEHSCNYFFYTVADRMNIDIISEYAKGFGLGEYTGIELDEKKGYMSTKENKLLLLDEDWYPGDTLSAAIGQSITAVTPIQLANYTAALASNGTLHSASMLKSVRSYDYSEKVYERVAEVVSENDFDESYYEAIQVGMYRVATSGTSATVKKAFEGASYTVAAKTGTAQVGTDETSNGVFICYAPYENPEIAIAVVVEKGGSGSALAQIAREVLDYYFTFKYSEGTLETELSLLR